MTSQGEEFDRLASAVPSVIDGYAIDSNVQLVIDDVRALRRELQRGPDETTAAYLTQLAAGT